MKKLILSLILTISLTSAFAFNLDDALDKLEDNAKASVQNSAKKEGKVSLSSLTDGIKNEADNKIAELEERINDRIEYYDNKIDSEVDKAIGDVRKNIDELESIKNKAYGLIKFVKIFLSILSFSTILILFLVWRAFKRIKNLYKLLDNIRSYKDIEARIKALETKQA